LSAVGTEATVDLRRLMHPSSIAVVGATDRPGSYAAQVLLNIETIGFEGDVWGVNPGRDEVLGHPCVPSIAELPVAADALVVAIPAAGVPGVIDDAGARGCGGAVVIISSVTGMHPGPRTAYAAAKAAEIHLAATAAQELAADGIRVNAVSPGSILFPGGGWDSFARNNPDDFASWLQSDLPFGRLGRLEEVADVVTFLLSGRASWVTGANVPVDGAQIYPAARRFR